MRRVTKTALAAGLFSVASLAGAAQAQEAYIGEIRMFGNVFCPEGWLETSGQMLPVVDYLRLFSLLGATYGGDGRSTFALPDLRGAIPVHSRTGPGRTDVNRGATLSVALGRDAPEANDVSTALVGARYCIAVEGVFPPRS